MMILLALLPLWHTIIYSANTYVITAHAGSFGPETLVLDLSVNGSLGSWTRLRGPPILGGYEKEGGSTSIRA
jgi:hypothetical protein